MTHQVPTYAVAARLRKLKYQNYCALVMNEIFPRNCKVKLLLPSVVRITILKVGYSVSSSFFTFLLHIPGDIEKTRMQRTTR